MISVGDTHLPVRPPGRKGTFLDSPVLPIMLLTSAVFLGLADYFWKFGQEVPPLKRAVIALGACAVLGGLYFRCLRTEN